MMHGFIPPQRYFAYLNWQRIATLPDQENTVLLLTRHFDQQFEDSDTIAADVIARLHIPGSSLERFREWMSGAEAHEDTDQLRGCFRLGSE